jgi:tight adherence protein B
MNTIPVTDETALYLICLGIGLGLLLAVSALRNVLSRKETGSEIVSRRLRMIHDNRSIEERIALLKPGAENPTYRNVPVLGALSAVLRRARSSLSPIRFLVLCGAFAVASFAGMVVFLPAVLALPVALVLGFGIPIVIVQARAKARAQALISQLPDALDLLARGLRVGHPLNTSIGSVAQQMPDPIGSEFGLIFDQVNYGENLPDAFQEFAERVDLEDVHYLSSSIGIQHGTGSDLARMIDVLSKVIRSRAMLRRKVRAISAEGRATAFFLSAVPVLMFGFTSLMSPDYFGGVMDDPLFIPMAASVVALTVLNAIIMNRLVNFHV